MNPEEHIEHHVMSKIEQGQVEQRPKLFFVVEKYGLAGVIILSIAVAIGIAALIAFSFKASRAYDYLRFGLPGLPAFFEAVPVMLLILLFIVFAAAFFFFMKTDVSYKKPLTVMVLATVGFILLSGGAIAYSRISDNIQASLERSGVVRPFVPGVMPAHKRGMVGEVTEVGEGYVVIQTKRGSIVVDTSLYTGPAPVEGMLMMVVGGREEDVFRARGVRILRTVPTMLPVPMPVLSTTGTPVDVKGLRHAPMPNVPSIEESSSTRSVLVFPEEMPLELRTCFALCLSETHSLQGCRTACVHFQGAPIFSQEKSEIQVQVGL